MVAVVIGLVLAGAGIGLAYNAAASLAAPNDSAPGWAAFAAACVSVVVKEALYQWTSVVGKRVRSSALMANAWHHRSDALSSAPFAIAVVGTRMHPEWTFLDPIAALVVSVLVLQAAWKITWPALNQLADAAASAEKRKAFHDLAMATRGVKEVHAVRTRHVGSGYQVDLHVLVEPDLSVREGHIIASGVKHRMLEQDEDVVDVLVHVEPFEPQARK
jgi:cation diffusion facilitator family transporter